ncbi:MAG: DUF58 domain-containing protein [Ruminococcus sp.]|jgi:hypothetical protein|nr:DUF58 domain-containing protein [Ruminococcus sp.]
MSGAYFLILIIVLCLNFLLPGDEYFSLLLAVTSLPILSFVLMLIGRKIKFELSAPEYAIKNGKTFITFCIKNPTIIPISSLDINISYIIYELGEYRATDKAISFSVMPLTKRKVTIEQVYDKYIYEEIQIKEIIVYDLLGIFHTKIKINDRSELCVIPNLSLDNETLKLPQIPHKSSEIGVREYRPGDMFSHIHQKLSSKSEVIFTRFYEDEVTVPLLVLDLKYCDDIDLAIEQYAQNAYALINDDSSVEMLNLGYDAKPSIIKDTFTLQKHLINVIKQLNTQKYNEYISRFDRRNYPIVYYFPDSLN